MSGQNKKLTCNCFFFYSISCQISRISTFKTKVLKRRFWPFLSLFKTLKRKICWKNKLWHRPNRWISSTSIFTKNVSFFVCLFFSTPIVNGWWWKKKSFCLQKIIKMAGNIVFFSTRFRQSSNKNAGKKLDSLLNKLLRSLKQKKTYFSFVFSTNSNHYLPVLSLNSHLPHQQPTLFVRCWRKSQKCLFVFLFFSNFVFFRCNTKFRKSPGFVLFIRAINIFIFVH